MRKIMRIFALEWSRMLAYRADVLMWMSAEAAIPLVSLAIWYTVARTSHGVPSPRDTLTYFLIVMFLIILTDAWNGYFLGRSILNGEIVQYLVRPISPFWPQIANNIVEKILKLLIPLPIFLAILWLWPDKFSPAIYRPEHITLFVISVILAMVVSFNLDMLFGVLAFWFDDILQIRRYKDILQQAMSGILIPLAFLPPSLKPIFTALPFRYIISAPAEILLGQASSVLRLLLAQLIWILALTAALIVLWRRGLKIYAVPGQ